MVVLRINFDCQKVENSQTLEAYNSKNTPPSDLKPGSKDADDLVDAKKRVFSEKNFRFKVEKRQKLKSVFFDSRQKISEISHSRHFDFADSHTYKGNTR